MNLIWFVHFWTFRILSISLQHKTYTNIYVVYWALFFLMALAVGWKEAELAAAEQLLTLLALSMTAASADPAVGGCILKLLTICLALPPPSPLLQFSTVTRVVEARTELPMLVAPLPERGGIKGLWTYNARMHHMSKPYFPWSDLVPLKVMNIIGCCCHVVCRLTWHRSADSPDWSAPGSKT